jgi:PIN domain nuclease of toxin-antitoxin system
MQALLDTGVWFRRYHRLPMGPALQQYLDQVTEFYLSPLSVAEISYKWQRGKLPQVPDPEDWMAHSLENFILLDLSPSTALQAGLWPWSHGDLVDRSLAALAAGSGITLVHTDKVLRDLEGFPQKWFKNVSD